MSDLAAPDGRDSDLRYMRVANDIAARIKSGELAPGTRLRSELDLAERYGVAYQTIRHAMKVLRERGDPDGKVAEVLALWALPPETATRPAAAGGPA